VTISSSDVCDEIVNKLCTKCIDYPACAGSDDVDEWEFRERLLNCIDNRIVYVFKEFQPPGSREFQK